MGIATLASNQTMTDGETRLQAFGLPAGTIQIKSTGAAAVVSIVGSNLGASDAAVLPLDDGSTTLTLADGVPQVVNVAMPLALIGIRKVSGTGAISAVVSAPGL